MLALAAWLGVSKNTTVEGEFSLSPVCGYFLRSICICSIASIDFSPPLLVSGSSDKHLRVFDVTTGMGWTTVPDLHAPAPAVCHVCGATDGTASDANRAEMCVHMDLVRSVALGEEFVISGSYDLSIKVRCLAGHLC